MAFKNFKLETDADGIALVIVGVARAISRAAVLVGEGVALGD